MLLAILAYIAAYVVPRRPARSRYSESAMRRSRPKGTRKKVCFGTPQSYSERSSIKDPHGSFPLFPQSAEKPEARRIDFMLSHLRDRTPQEIAIFYNSATDEERLVMEAAAASVGRVPMKVGNGLQWQPLLDADTVNESVIARATAKNPAGAMKLQELSEIRSMHVTVAAHAVAEINDVMSR